MILFSQLPKITTGTIVQLHADKKIEQFITDSRKALATDAACFFAIKGERNDGHDYISQLYDLGIRQFVVERPIDRERFPLANFFQAVSSLQVIQNVAAHHRKGFSLTVIGITGSNGKTIIKEWLYQLLEQDFKVIKNPGSYNSQLGVPLSALMIGEHHQLGIFEAGISRSGEMTSLQKILRPDLGILTNIGSSHDTGFADRQQKVREKLILFGESKLVVYCADHDDVWQEIDNWKKGRLTLGWGQRDRSDVHIRQMERGQVRVSYEKQDLVFLLPFGDAASRENVMHCIILLLYLKVPGRIIQERIMHLKSVPMRLELKQGVNQCQIIDDTYNNDLAGLRISLDFLAGHQKQKKTLILSDMPESSMSGQDLAQAVAALALKAGITSFIGIGPHLSEQSKHFQGFARSVFFLTTEQFFQGLDLQSLQSELILVKGARAFQFERIVQRLQKKVHGTVMEIDLNALVHNLNYFKSLLKPEVRLMVMVKAFAYGSGSEEIATLLQYHRVSYLGVAYTDEGVELRKHRISLPIMVMNPSVDSFPVLIEYHLEPEIYSLKLLRSLSEFLGGRNCKVHLKFDTGMHRLGLEQTDLAEVAEILLRHPGLVVASAFTHLAGSDEGAHDAFTHLQVGSFQELYAKLCASIGYRPLRHALNSPGILRFPEYQFEMVRLGIGLYGIDPTNSNRYDLMPVATLKTVVSQIRTVKAGDSIGYGRKGLVDRDTKIATLAIGYADGYSRSFSNGSGVVLVKGVRAPVIGNVCMDMTMVDVTGVDAKEGDEVVIYGDGLPIQEVATRIQTIPYEILTSTSERVKRVFHAESI